ncbi:hypothetical protein C8Q78DRAFT_1019260 [Trametes maxima]|nr:hypothetical protein C8Q78DRAFT_1019260 [Trametes maxima]
MADLSLRHIPDLSDASAIADFSDASFQIPRASGASDDLLLADDTMDFFGGANDTLNTPAPPPSRHMPWVQPPLTLAELTPRSKPLRTAPIRSSLRPRPGVATPHKAAVASQLSAALSEDLSPFRHQEPSFQIPQTQGDGGNLLMADDGPNFLEEEEPSLDHVPSRARTPLTLSQLTPGPSTRMRLSPSASPNPQSHALSIPQINSAHNYDERSLEKSRDTTPAIYVAPTAASPLTSDPVDEHNNGPSFVERPAEKGKVKELNKGRLAEKQKKLSAGGEKAKRKRVTPAAAVTKPAKLKPLTASLARRVSIGGRKPAPGMRRRPLQGPSVSTSTAGAKNQRLDNVVQSSSSTLHTAVKPTLSGGLANTLLSFGQKLMADAESPVHFGEPFSAASTSVPEVTAPSPTSHDRPLDIQAASHSDEHHSMSPDPLTVSQLSPRKTEDIGRSSTTLASGSRSTEEAPTEVLDQPTAEPQMPDAGRPPSPMRRSIKRAGSPADQPSTHQRKRSKTTSGHSAPTSSKECAPSRPALQPSRARNAPAAALNAGAARARRVASTSASSANPSANSGQARKPEISTSRTLSRSGVGKEASTMKKTYGPGRDAILDNDSGTHAASASSGSRSGDAVRSQRENVPDTEEHPLGGQPSGHASSRGPSAPDRPSSNSTSAKPTKPMEFHFATSTRIDARKTDLEKSGGGSSSHAASLRRSKAQTAGHAIPDFKALHALHQSQLAQRKAEIMPVVPLPIEFQTDARAREREKFEEARRAREAELERQREERRRQQELEEEREIKELRRRAVPKANEVPEWYALAPKKSKAGTGN